MRWPGHMARDGERRDALTFLLGESKGGKKPHLEGVGVNGRIVLKMGLKKVR